MVLHARLEIFVAVQAAISVTHLVECQSSWLQRIGNLIRFFQNAINFNMLYNEFFCLN